MFFYPLANSYQRIFEQQNTAVFKHFWQAFLSWNGLSDRPSQKFMAGMSCVRVDYIFGKHLIKEDLFPTGGQDSSVNAGPKSSKSLLTVSVLPIDDGVSWWCIYCQFTGKAIVMTRYNIANNIHSSVNVLWKTWNAWMDHLSLFWECKCWFTCN